MVLGQVFIYMQRCRIYIFLFEKVGFKRRVIFGHVFIYTQHKKGTYLAQNQHTRELISAQNMQHKDNNKDPSRLR